MWDIGSSAHSILPDSSHSILPDSRLGHEINVLLVDPEKGQHTITTSLLQRYSYKGIKVETAAAALSLLSKGKKEFDLVLIDINIQDMDAFKLVKLSANMKLLTMMMSENDDDAIISKALKSGAFLVVSKPFSIDVVKQLRQHVIRERMQSVNKYDDGTNVIVGEAINGASDNRNELKRKSGIAMKERAEKIMAKNLVVKKGRKGRKPNKNQSENNRVRNGRVKRKTSMEWTKELHEKFMDAVNQLGEGRCYPKEILETMNTPGLTRMQVASYLQRCRNDNWQTPGMRKYHHPTSFRLSNDGRDNQRRFGSMPHANQIQPNVQENILAPEIDPSLDCDFTDIEARQNQHTSRVRKGRGPPPIVNLDSELEANYCANEAIYIPTSEKTSEILSYNPVNLDVGATAMDQQQPSDDLFAFYEQSMDDYVPDLTAVMHEASTVNHASASQPFFYNSSLPDQATMTSEDIGGEWNPNGTNFYGTDE